jgi:hypothetical protein
MTVLPNQVEITWPSGVSVKMTENVSLSAPALSEHSSSDKVGGSIGTARWTR